MEIEGTNNGSPFTIAAGSEIPYSDLIYTKEIGRGNFGVVYEGICQRKKVAIKEIPCNISPQKMDEIRQEIKINLTLRHPNVVLTLGACTTQSEKIIIVSELMKTDLSKLIFEGNEILPLLTRMKMCRDAAAGVLWLHTRNPPIIHRDIKLENFLVDENGIVKVCDFGLSQVKNEPNLQDKKNEAHGTPLWMPPEVLSAKKFTEKGRPHIPPDTNPRLADLIRRCWDDDPEKRPNFEGVVDDLDKVIKELEIPSSNARGWWTATFGTASKVPWLQFINAFCHGFGLVVPSISVEEVMASANQNCVFVTKCIMCFRELIVDKERDEVAAEKFGEAVAWLGDVPENGRRIMRTAMKLMSEKYFFGDCSMENSETLLTGNPPGTFLVRFSSTSLGGYTISKVTRVGTIRHIRIDHAPGSVEYSMGGIRKGSLTELIDAVRESNRLEAPCPGWPFSHLFYDKVVKGGYGDGYSDGYNDDDVDVDGDEEMI